MLEYCAWLLVSFVICYLLGSINFAVIVSKAVAKRDVRDYGSGNAGMTNVIRTVGIVPGIITFVGDALKGATGVLLSKHLIILPAYARYADEVIEFLSPYYAMCWCAVFALLGHVFPLFFQFKGGKGVATAIGVLYCINWQAATFVLVTFLVLVAITKIVSVGSVMGAVEWVIYIFIYSASSGTVMRLYSTAVAAILASIVIIKHKDNIVRLHNGEEKMLKSKR